MSKLTILFLATIFVVSLAKHHNKDALVDIERVNTLKTSWKAGYNGLSHLGKHEFRKLLGTIIPSDNQNIRRRHIKVRDNIPDSFDAREEWPDCESISSIKNQGQCSSCWAVSTSSSASDRLCIASNAVSAVNLSSVNLMTCCSDCTVGNACDPGYTTRAWKYIQNTGLVTGGDYNSKEGCQPYPINPDDLNPAIPTCNDTCTNPSYNTPYDDDIYNGDSSYSLPQDVQQIQSDLMENGPLVSSFTVYDDLQNYKTGVYQNTTTSGGYGHAARVIGWGTDDDSGLDYWIVANSWGPDWGDKGTFKIRRGVNECGFEHHMTAGLIGSNDSE